MKRTTLKTRLWALAATLLLLVSLLALPVSAAAPTATDGKITFNKYLVMDKEANVPNVTFEFTIAAGQPATYGEEGTVKTAVYAGIMGDTHPVIYAGNNIPQNNEDYGKVTFAVGNDTTDITPVAPETEATQKKASKELTVDFTGVTFPAPGIYRYVITETNGGSSGITYDTSRTLDVYVQYKKNTETGEGQPVYTDELEVAYYVLQEGTAVNPDNATTNGQDATKSDGFTNTYTTQNLTLKKEVEGNQGDKNKYFKFTVEITGATKGNKYTVDLEHADSTISSLSHTNPSELTVAENGTVSGTFYLKNDQYIVIQGLTSDTQYKITEDNSYKDDGYSTTYKIGEAEAEPGLSTPDDATVGNTDISVVFTNTKNGSVPTGILLETAPYLILGAVVVAGLVVLFATRRRRTRE